MKLLTTRSVDYLELLRHDLQKKTLLLSFSNVFSGALSTTSGGPSSSIILEWSRASLQLISPKLSNSNDAIQADNSSTCRRQNFDFWVCRWTSLLNLERVCTVCWDQSCHSWTEWSTSPDSTAVSERAARCLHEAFQLRLKACWNISPLLKSTSGSAMEFSLFLPAACVTSAAIRYEVKFM